MAWGVFDRADNNDIVGGVLTSEAAAFAFMQTYEDDEGYENLYTDRVCDKHGIYGGEQPESDCECWCEGPYEGIRDWENVIRG